MRLYKILFTAIFCLLINFNIFSQVVPIKTKPSWVKNHEENVQWENTNKKITGAYYYLLVDNQTSIQHQSIYRKHAIKILNNEGVQQRSDISVIYDPSYQKLIFHEVIVYRNGKKINKLIDHDIRTFHRERGGERYLYDDRLEAVINLRDIRVKDIITYSYSIQGFNPVYKGHSSSSFEFEYSVPVLEIKNRLITRNDHPVTFKHSHKELKSSINELDGGKEYMWEKSNTKALLYDKNVPDWYDPYEKVSYSDYNSWKEVVQHIAPLYKLDNEELKSIKIELEELINAKDKTKLINDVIRFVQDDVRYLGFENGINAFKPHSPLQVLEQRFGDCKDKSFLLCAILKSYNIEANPMLVNTSLKEHISNELPSFGAFNHCVTQICLDTSTFYIDPTINNQGGNLSSINFPNYGAGLIIKEGVTELIKLPKPIERGTQVFQQFIIPNEKDSITLKIKTITYDSQADQKRAYFANNSLDEITKNYLNYYSAQYPGIISNQQVKFIDNRTHDNQFIVEEEYIVSNFGTSLKEKGIEYGFYALDFEDYLYVPKSPSRTMPYATPYQTDYTLNMLLCFPSTPNGYEETKKYNNDAYQYYYESKIFGDTVSITHQYKTLKEHISNNNVESYLESHQKMRDYLYYTAEFNPIENIKFTFSWTLSLIFLGLIIFGGLFSYKLYYSFDLLPKFALRKDKSIGGFLFVIVFLLILNLLYWVVSLLENGKYLNVTFWEIIQETQYSLDASVVKILFGGEMFYEALQFSFIIMLLILFFKKRTTFPKLAIIYMLVNLSFTIIITFLVEYFEAERVLVLSGNAIIWTIIITCICIPYLKNSNRVEQTFIHSLGK